jgi:hypothetical protein
MTEPEVGVGVGAGSAAATSGLSALDRAAASCASASSSSSSSFSTVSFADCGASSIATSDETGTRELGGDEMGIETASGADEEEFATAAGVAPGAATKGGSPSLVAAAAAAVTLAVPLGDFDLCSGEDVTPAPLAPVSRSFFCCACLSARGDDVALAAAFEGDDCCFSLCTAVCVAGGLGGKCVAIAAVVGTCPYGPGGITHDGPAGGPNSNGMPP